MSALAAMAAFIVDCDPPAEARARATAAVIDTIGVALAGTAEPASRIVRETITTAVGAVCSVWGTDARASDILRHRTRLLPRAEHEASNDRLCAG